MISIRELEPEAYPEIAAAMSRAGTKTISPEALRAEDEGAGSLRPTRWLVVRGSGGEVLVTLRPRPDGRGVIDWFGPDQDAQALQVSLTSIDCAAGQRRLSSVVASVETEHSPHGRTLMQAGYRVASRTAALMLDPSNIPLELKTRLRKAADRATQHGIVVRSMAELEDDPDRDRKVCALDNALRHEVTGTAGWEWSLEAFLDETYTPGFDPERYLIALNGRGAFVGLLRIWMNPSGPKLGLIGVLPAYRRLGVAAALTDRTIASWPDSETRLIRAGTDAKDAALLKLARRVGFRTTRTVVEMERTLS